MTRLRWQKSSYSEGGADTCIEIADNPVGCLHLRESDTPATVITTTPPALRALLREISVGSLKQSLLRQMERTQRAERARAVLRERNGDDPREAAQAGLDTELDRRPAEVAAHDGTRTGVIA